MANRRGLRPGAGAAPAIVINVYAQRMRQRSDGLVK
jgi:hypothetical protein